MNVVVDTSVWSEVLRRKLPNKQLTATLTSLIEEHRVKLLGPVRQEILSAISILKQFELLRDKLSSFPDVEIISGDYILAAEYNNLCRKKGVQVSHTDFLICTVSHRINASIFTTDKDFINYSKILPINLY